MTEKEVSTAVVDVAKKAEKKARGEDNIITLPTGERAKLMPVSATLISEVTSHIKEPEVPTWFDENKQREVPNPNDPDYLKAVEAADRARGLASLDALIMFGVTLLDGMPEDDSWLNKLKFMERRGQLDLSSFDLKDPLDKEFLYKRFIAVPVYIATRVGQLSGVSDEEVLKAEESFPS